MTSSALTEPWNSSIFHFWIVPRNKCGATSPFGFQFWFQEQGEGTGGCTAPRGPVKELRSEKTERQGRPTHQPLCHPLLHKGRRSWVRSKMSLYEIFVCLFFAYFYFSVPDSWIRSMSNRNKMTLSFPDIKLFCLFVLFNFTTERKKPTRLVVPTVLSMGVMDVMLYRTRYLN